MHKPILLQDISLTFANKNCFADFSSTIHPNSHIAIIGKNGSGKSSLLNILRGTTLPSSGIITMPDTISIGYVEQTILELTQLSGGQRFNKKLSAILAQSPDLLLLDEPTNHLDQNNRQSLLRMLSNYRGTLIVVTHDLELLRNCVDSLWHIQDYKIHTFTGSYDTYMHEIQQKHYTLEKEIYLLKNKQKRTHSALMQEQERAAKSKVRGQKKVEQRKWIDASNSSMNRNITTTGRKKLDIKNKHTALSYAIIKFKTT